jgi:non-specific serine/threonine protein kinase
MVGDQSPPSFGQLLRTLRVAAGLTQEELAERGGLSPRGISDLERGARRSPHPATVRRLAAALRLDAEDRAALQAAARRVRAPARGASGSPSAPDGLPRPLTSFVGRAREQAELDRALREHRLITLTGTGGIGKSRLALALAHQAVPEHADKAVLVELAALADPLLVPRAVAAAVGVREPAGGALLDALVAALANARRLVVLDNCEHLLAACAALVGVLLPACPGLRVLATSREALGLADEAVWPVPALEVGPNGAPPADVERLTAYGAVQLFVERARAVWPTFVLTEQNAPAVARVCRRLEGIPLALELAAARTRVLSVEQIDVRLADRYRLLVWGAAGAPVRHQTLQAAVDWSYSLLSETGRLLFDRLSVFRGGATLEAIEAVCGDDPGVPGVPWTAAGAGNEDHTERGETVPAVRVSTLPPPPTGDPSDAASGCRLPAADIADLLQALEEKSLVVAAPEPDGTVRFSQLETLREYAHARLVERGEAETVGACHLAYHAGLAERAATELRGPDQLSWLDRFEREHDNVRAALAWAEAHDSELDAGLRLAAGIWIFWDLRGHVAGGRRWLEGLLARTGPATPRAQALARGAAGLLARLNGDLNRALTLHEEALALRRQIGDELGVASELSHLAIVMSEQGDRVRARALFEESLARSRALGDRVRVAGALQNLGITARLQGQLDEACAYLEQALDLHRALGNRRSEDNALHSLGNVALERGDAPQAADRYREALALAQELGDRAGVARCLEGFASILIEQGRQPAQAAQLYGAAEALREAAGIPANPSGRARHEERVAELERVLGCPAFPAAWQRGRALSPARAARLALNVYGKGK